MLFPAMLFIYIKSTEKMSLSQKGKPRNSTRLRKCQDPEGNIYNKLIDAARVYNMTSEGIRYRWSTNKNGWRYVN